LVLKRTRDKDVAVVDCLMQASKSSTGKGLKWALHISEQSGHPFRTNPATHFGVKAATCFGPIRPPLPVSLLRSF
jgi:hypothetical protein